MFILTMEGYYRDGNYGTVLYTDNDFETVVKYIENGFLGENEKIHNIEASDERNGMKRWVVTTCYNIEAYEEDSEQSPEWEQDKMQWYVITEAP